MPFGARKHLWDFQTLSNPVGAAIAVAVRASLKVEGCSDWGWGEAGGGARGGGGGVAQNQTKKQLRATALLWG